MSSNIERTRSTTKLSGTNRRGQLTASASRHNRIQQLTAWMRRVVDVSRFNDVLDAVAALASGDEVCGDVGGTLQRGNHKRDPKTSYDRNHEKNAYKRLPTRALERASERTAL